MDVDELRMEDETVGVLSFETADDGIYIESVRAAVRLAAGGLSVLELGEDTRVDHDPNQERFVVTFVGVVYSEDGTIYRVELDTEAEEWWVNHIGDLEPSEVING